MEINDNEKRTEWKNEGEMLEWSNKIKEQNIEIEKLTNKIEAIEYKLGEAEELNDNYKDAMGNLCRVLSTVLMDM